MSMTILLGDDHTVVRQGLRKILEDQEGWEVVAEASDGRTSVRLAAELRPRVAVLDVSMPLLNGIEAARQISRRHPDTGVLMLSMHEEEAFVTTALQAGARGYVLKESADSELIHGVAAVAAGKSFFSPGVAKAMLNDYRRKLDGDHSVDPFDSLSPREREILQLIAEGHSNKDVANILGISVATVETHRAHILQKLDVHSTAQLVLYAVRKGVVS